jgi:hypothetical protein
MLDSFAARWPATIKNMPARTRRCTIGVAIVAALLIIGVLGSTHPGALAHSGLAGCTSLSSPHHPTARDYPKIRAQFAGSRWPDLRTAGTAYIDLAMRLRHARYTDGYETVWFYQRLSADCAKHQR